MWLHNSSISEYLNFFMAPVHVHGGMPYMASTAVSMHGCPAQLQHTLKPLLYVEAPFINSGLRLLVSLYLFKFTRSIWFQVHLCGPVASLEMNR